MGWQLARGPLARWTFLALGRRRWRRTGRRVAVLRRLRIRLRILCPVGTRLWLGERLQLSVLWRLRLLLITTYLTYLRGHTKVAPLALNSSFKSLLRLTRLSEIAQKLVYAEPRQNRIQSSYGEHFKPNVPSGTHFAVLKLVSRQSQARRLG
jgi:hypothetical protein